MLDVYEQIERRYFNEQEYQSSLLFAAPKLQAALLQYKDNGLIATGCRHYALLENVYNNEILPLYDIQANAERNCKIEKFKRESKIRVQISNYSKDNRLDIAHDRIYIKDPEILYYKDIEIDFINLQKIFPKPVEKRGRRSILSKEELSLLEKYISTLASSLMQKQKVYLCQEWLSKNLGKEVAEETIRGYLKPVKTNG